MTVTIGRRELLAAIGGAAVAWPLAARAQQDDRRRVGIFMDLAEQDREGQTRVAAFREGMQKLGWIEGRNVTYEYRWTAGDPAVMERYAAELLALKPEVIMNGGLPTLVAMQRQTRTTPIVFAQVLDPVGAGFVDSLMRPGGNITGFVSFEYSMRGARTLRGCCAFAESLATARAPGMVSRGHAAPAPATSGAGASFRATLI